MSAVALFGDGIIVPKQGQFEMKAITVEPHRPQTAYLEDVPEPEARGGSVLVETIAVGVCGTDVEIVEGKYGWALGARRASCSGMNPLAACSIRVRAARFRRGISWSASSGVPTRCLAPTVQ
jgi:hypothetical protein